MTSEEFRVRFAPSPTGLLHVCIARMALVGWLFVRQMGRDFLLCMEDTAFERSEARFTMQQIEGLLWLGVDLHAGPGKGRPGDPFEQERAERFVGV